MLDELQRQANPPVRLVIFGDSWARDDQMKTWPELLAQNLGWAAVNVALPGSDSNTLPLQLRLLETVLERSNRRLHPDAWALVHTGGNDFLRAGPKDILRAVLRTLCGCCACLPICWGAFQMLDEVANNVRALAARLREPPFGVRNLLLVGLPLCQQMPVVVKYTQFLLGVSPALQFAGRHAGGRLNATFLDRLQAIKPQLGGDGEIITLDEASALEAIAKAAAGDVAKAAAAKAAAAEQRKRQRQQQRQQQRAANGHGDADADEEEDRAAAGAEDEDEEDLGGDGVLWSDMMHPSQRAHLALSLVMRERFELARATAAHGGGDGLLGLLASFVGGGGWAARRGEVVPRWSDADGAGLRPRGNVSSDGDGSGSDGPDAPATARLI